jgi:quinol monooxygenase YgiN
MPYRGGVVPGQDLCVRRLQPEPSRCTVPVVVTAVFYPIPGRNAELIDALRATIPAVHGEEGCLLYAIHDAADGTITMIEKWESAEALEAHASGGPVKALRSAVEGLVAQAATVTTMTPLPAGTAEQGEL